MQPAHADLSCRRMQRQDIPALAELLPEVLGGDWSAQYLQSQIASSHEYFVLVTDDAQQSIIGFAEFYCVLDECHLLNFAILKRWQRQGMAKIFMKRLSEVMRTRGSVRCLLEVRRSNVPAVHLYEATGFVLDGIRPAYYPAFVKDGPREDALLYSWSLSASN